METCGKEKREASCVREFVHELVGMESHMALEQGGLGGQFLFCVCVCFLLFPCSLFSFIREFSVDLSLIFVIVYFPHQLICNSGTADVEPYHNLKVFYQGSALSL